MQGLWCLSEGRGPKRSCVFKGRVNHGGISGCFHLSTAILEDSAYEAECFIPFSSNNLCVTSLSCPDQVAGDSAPRYWLSSI